MVSDPWRLPAWWPGVQRVEEATPEAWTKVLASPKGRIVRADYTCVQSEAPHRLIWRQEVDESPFERVFAESLAEIELEPAGEGETRVKLTLDQRLRGKSRFGGMMVRRAMRRNLDEALDGLKRAFGG